MKAIALSIMVVVGLVAVRPVRADDTAGYQMYRVRQGDTLDLIAAEFYGDRNHAIFIMAENRITHPRKLVPGERLKIPVTREITTAPNDSFDTLAAQYLGNKLRGTFLANFNHMAPEDSLPAGTTLTIPFHVMHQAQANETLAQIAAAYTGDSKNADLLRRYNFLDKDAIEKGETIVVPIHFVAVKATKLPPIDADSKQRREHQRAAQLKATAALPLAYAAWREGDFIKVKRLLFDLEQDDRDFLTAKTATDVGVLLASAYVAYDDQLLAVAAFKHVLERNPQLALDPYRYSPKVLDAFRKAHDKRDQP